MSIKIAQSSQTLDLLLLGVIVLRGCFEGGVSCCVLLLFCSYCCQRCCLICFLSESSLFCQIETILLVFPTLIAKAQRGFCLLLRSSGACSLNNQVIMSEKVGAEQDRQRSQLLKKQLAQMGEDFEFMKKSRDEWKKQLQARFQDIERKIQSSKQYIANEAKRTNDTLLAFQHKFNEELTNTKTSLQNNIDSLAQQTNQNFQQKDKEVADLNKNLTEETKNRNTQFEEGKKDTLERIAKTNEALEKEKQTRIASEKENMGKVNESLYLLKEQLKEERDQRNQRLKELQNNNNHELASQRKHNQEFHNKTFNDFKVSLGDLRGEMEARFNSKDEIINSLSKVVKTLQDTLRHPN